MELTMMYDGWEIPFLGKTGIASACHGRFASRTEWINAATRIHIIAPRFIGDVPGSSVPSGRRLRS